MASEMKTYLESLVQKLNQRKSLNYHVSEDETESVFRIDIRENVQMEVSKDFILMLLTYPPKIAYQTFAENILQGVGKLNEGEETSITLNKSKVYPVIRKEGCFAESLELVTVFPNIPEVQVYFAEDLGENVIYISKTVLEQNQMSTEELVKLALENAEKLPQKPKRKQFNQDFSCLDYYTGDGFAPSRVLAVPFEKIQKQFKGDIWFSMPHTDSLQLFDSTDTLVSVAKLKTRREFQESGKYGVSPHLYCWKEGEITIVK